MNKIQIQQIQLLLEKPKKIAIVGHRNPDGDAIGSCLALSQVLDKLGHTTTVLMPNAHPKYLRWLPNSNQILNYENHKKKIDSILTDIEVIFTLDFNSLSRVVDLQQALKKLLDRETPFVMIDHHQSPDDYALVTYSDTGLSSTAQMVYHFMESLEWLSLLDVSIATCIYAGIVTDTGSFKYRSTTPTTLRVAAKLIEAGVDNTKINNNLFDANSEDRLKLLSTALRNLVVLEEYNSAYITLTQAELDAHNFKKGDTEGFVNYALSIENVNLALIFIENAKEEIIKISLRSKGNFSVNQMARKHFNGGGHDNAAGGKYSKNMEDTIAYFKGILVDYKKDLTDDFK